MYFSVSPLISGLFYRVIMQCGDCINNPGRIGVPSEDIVCGLTIVDQRLDAMSASSVSDQVNPGRFAAVDV